MIPWYEICPERYTGPDLALALADFEAKGYRPITIRTRFPGYQYGEEYAVAHILTVAEEHGRELGDWTFMVWDDYDLSYVVCAMFRDDEDAMWAQLALT